VAVTTELEARILACTDLERLDSWVGKAVTVTSGDALFADE
jgi:hypothetical protein